MNNLASTTKTKYESLLNVPQELKPFKIWIVCEHGPVKANGKFDKIPIHPISGQRASYKTREIQMTFIDAYAALQRCAGANGLGIVLPDEQIKVGAETGYLVACDYDGENGSDQRAINLLKRDFRHLKGCYLEKSPSGFGYRALVLSKKKPATKNYGGGFEVYAGVRWVTVTGNEPRGKLKDCTFGLCALLSEIESEQLSVTPWQLSAARLESNLSKMTVETLYSKELESKILEALNIVGPNQTNEEWTHTCWAVLSTGWPHVPQILRDWSKGAPELYDAAAMESVIERYQPGGGITLGTLFHKAKLIKPSFDAVLGRALVEKSEAQIKSNWMMTVGELLNSTPPPWLIEGLIPQIGVGAIYGPPGSGKTFLSIHLSFKVAIGEQFFGLRTASRSVIYCALEGQAGIQKRFLAAAKEERVYPLNFRVIKDGLNLANAETVDRLIESVRATFDSGALIFIDTLNQSIPGADENSSTDMSNLISSVNRISRELKSFVMLVHHSGKDDSRGLRGHSSLAGAMDVIIKVKSGVHGNEWTIMKNKDGDANPHGSFDLVPHTVEVGPAKKVETSCAVKPVYRLPNTPRKGPTGKHQKVLYPLISNHGGSATVDQLVDAFAHHLECASNRQKTNAKEAICGMLESGHLIESSGGICLPPN